MAVSKAPPLAPDTVVTKPSLETRIERLEAAVAELRKIVSFNAASL